jgi:AcrR family transcriptional regulator
LVDNEIKIHYRHKADALAGPGGYMAGERATKMLILSSARTLFSEKGYDETAVEEICALAGVAKGTFFYYFESKQAIVRFILTMQLEEYRDKLREQMETLKDAISKMEYFIAALIEQSDIGTEPETYFKHRESDWFKSVVNEERMNTFYPLLEYVVVEGIEQGFFKVKTPDVCSAIAFLGIDAYLHHSMRKDEDAKKGIREMTAKILGIKESILAI